MKKLLLGSIVILGMIIIYFVISTFPRDIQINAEGMKYRLGNENIGKEESVRIKIDGKLYKSIAGNKTFKGIIHIEGEEIPVPENQRQLEIHFRKERYGSVVYTYIEDGKPYMFNYGTIYIDKSFSKATFTVFDRMDNNQGTWSADNGIMISVPASDRGEALGISNMLMNKYLDGYVLK